MMKKVSLIFLLFFIFFSCQKTTRPKGEDLKTAWQRYWTYKKEGYFEKSFYYENVSITKQTSLEKYIKNRKSSGVRIKDFEFINIGKKGSGPMGSTPVKMRLVTNWPPILNIKGYNNRVILDYWIKKQGQWYHLIPGLTGYW